MEETLREKLAAQALYLTDRFSPGYGDMPLAQSGQICEVLNAGRSIGLTVSQSGILMPRKSVTAVLGISRTQVLRRPKGCEGVFGAPNLRICKTRRHNGGMTMAYTKAITLLDGAMGTMLQKAGLKLGDRPETLSITAADVVEGIQRQYVQAGTRLLLANTFCANAHKLAGTGFEVEDVIRASVAVAKRACAGTDAKVLLDVGPIGELLEPLGTLKFDEAYTLYAQMIRAGAAAGAEGVFFETFSDLNELRAGVLAAKECSDLPVFASMTLRGFRQDVPRLPCGCGGDGAGRAGRGCAGCELLPWPEGDRADSSSHAYMHQSAADSQTERRSARPGNGRVSYRAG